MNPTLRALILLISFLLAPSGSTAATFPCHQYLQEFTEQFSSGSSSSKLSRKEALESIQAERLRLLAKRNVFKDNHNREFQDAARVAIQGGDSGGEKVFFTFDNWVQKTLNDKGGIEDKNLIDGLNNRFKVILLEGLREDPFLRQELGDPKPSLEAPIQDLYEGFKSMAFSVQLSSGEGAKLSRSDIIGRVEKIYQEAVQKFSSELEEGPLAVLWGNGTKIKEKPRQWFTMGAGKDPQKADLAGRQAREEFSPDQVGASKVYESKNSQAIFEVNLAELLQASPAVIDNPRFKDAGLMVQANGHIFPGREILEVFRKNKVKNFYNVQEFRTHVRTRIKQMFHGFEATDEEIDQLKNYVESLDKFSPPVFSRERILIPYSEANKGIVSTDFRMIGSKNLEAMSLALENVRGQLSGLSPSEQLDTVLRSLADGVETVSEEIWQQKKKFHEIILSMLEGRPIITDEIKDHERWGLFRFTGDDGVYLPLMNLTPEHKREIIRQLNQTQWPDGYRITFVPPNYADNFPISEGMRSEYIVQAETVEKKFREEIFGFGKNRLPIKLGRNMTVAVEIMSVERGKEPIYRAYIKVKGSPLIESDKNQIENYFSGLPNPVTVEYL